MQGTLEGANMPVRMSIVPNIVNREQLRGAIALTSISFNLSRFIGPALAGVTIAWLGTSAAFVINGFSYLALIAAVLVIRLNPTAERTKGQGNVWLELKKGVRYVRRHSAIRGLLIIIALTALFGRGALEMMPAFAAVVFQRGSAAFAILTSAIGGGAIVAGFVLTRGTAWLTPNMIRYAATIGGVLVAFLGVVQNFWVAVAIVSALGVVLSLCGVGSQILIQTLVDDEVRGRVSSIWGMVAFGCTAVGGLVVGAAASVWSLQHTVIVTGILCSTSVAISAFRARTGAD
jgi:MFS family permease